VKAIGSYGLWVRTLFQRRGDWRL